MLVGTQQERGDLNSIFQLTVFMFPGNAPDRETAKKLITTLPSGKPGFPPTVATKICYVLFRLEVPGIGWNAISAAELDVNDSNAHPFNIESPRGMLDNLDRFRVKSDINGARSWSHLRAETRIGGGDKPAGHIRLWTK